MIDDQYLNNRAKIKISAVFHLRVIIRMESHCLCPSEGHKHGGHTITETSVPEFRYLNEALLLLSFDTLKLRLLLVQALFS